MEQEMNSNVANDAVMNVKIHDNALLGRVNDEGVYVLPSAITKELIQAKKYLEQKVENTIYLSCHLSTVEKNLTIMMNYSLIGNGDKVMVNWALVEEVAIADGLVTNQLITTICNNVYDYSEDVLLRAFADFNVYIKDEDSGEERKLYDHEKTALTDIIVKYNIAVQTIAGKKINKLCNKTCAKQLDYLKKSKSTYAKTILAEVEKGMDVYITLKTLEEGSVDEIDDKAMLDIINNAVEKVDLSIDFEEKEDQEDQKEFHEFRNEIFEDFRKETREFEQEAQSKIVKAASDETKPEILSMLSVIREAEKSEKQDTVNLKEYLSPKAGQTLEDMERHTKNKMAHLAEKLGEQEEQDKYQKLDDFLLTQKEKDAKQVKDRETKLDAILTAVTSGIKHDKGHVTTFDNPNSDQTAKVDHLDRGSGHGEVQVSGAGQTKDKKATKQVEQPKATKKETPKKKTKSTEKKSAPAKAKSDKKEEKKEEKSTATFTGAGIEAITGEHETGSNPKVDSVDMEQKGEQPNKEEQQPDKERQPSGKLNQLLNTLGHVTTAVKKDMQSIKHQREQERGDEEEDNELDLE